MYTPDGFDNDGFGLRPSSPLIDAGIGVFLDSDGTPADIGPAGGPNASRPLRRFARDDDHDGMSDGWEVLYGLDPLANDSQLDPDFDGITNVQEYAGSTDPLTSG